MTPSDKCAELVKSFEQCRLKAYKPTPNDIWTCGWGATEGVTKDTVWTQEHADSRFATDLAHFGARVSVELGGAPTTQSQYDAMTSLSYNIGIGAFEKSTVLRKHKAGDYAGAAAAFGMWDKQSGTVLRGLARRRAAEAAMYRTPA